MTIELLMEIIERWGFPAAFGIWLMWLHTRELRDIRGTLNKQAIINGVILKTLDVPDAVELALADVESNGEEH